MLEEEILLLSYKEDLIICIMEGDKETLLT